MTHEHQQANYLYKQKNLFPSNSSKTTSITPVHQADTKITSCLLYNVIKEEDPLAW